MTKKSRVNSLSLNSLNFRPIDVKSEKKGTKPLPDPTSISQMILLMLVCLCRKILFVDPSIKVGIYIILVFFGSILGDVLPIPKSYFSRKDNIFNLYFVKLSWGWTMSSVGLFVYFTSSVYCCGEKMKMRKHLFRLLIATIMWFLWTKLFDIIEDRQVIYLKINLTSRKQCINKGYSWNSFSISGHTFILIYCTLIIMEEAKALMSWETIKDHLRIEIHNRTTEQSSQSTPLESLTLKQLETANQSFETLTPLIRILFIGMTILVVVWDVMLMATIIYFHSTPEKFVASIVATLIWFFTYRFMFNSQIAGIPLPGEGVFRYITPVQHTQSVYLRRASLPLKNEKIPTFMGMPLNIQRGPTVSHGLYVEDTPKLNN
nr:EOG090X07YX [Macrothrix elegans]